MFFSLTETTGDSLPSVSTSWCFPLQRSQHLHRLQHLQKDMGRDVVPRSINWWFPCEQKQPKKYLCSALMNTYSNSSCPQVVHHVSSTANPAESPLDQIETLDLPIGWRCRWISRPPERWSDLSLKDHGGNVQWHRVCITLERYGGFYHAAQIKAVLSRLFLGTVHNIS